MKNLISLLMLLVVFTSCTEDVKFNNPAVQGLKDNVLWRANDSRATLGPNNSLVIEALTQYETLTLKTTSTNVGVYPLGTSDSKKATFVFSKDGVELTYATGINIGDGEIKITEFDPTNMTISGTFRFNAKNINNNPLGGDILNFQEGVFYKVRILPAL
ncbi:DUF6252 family protein [Flavobacterium sp.]|uniref:DUF6252 family protein n=1 Tax=Flavobacterium sp. TaxID=239 RepID=UPI002B4ABA11|nr:DUF6252 family protein [Flavobacterium sp.]HLF50697.1 DUF6252 family protein [Flavobacterium sp.]